MDNSKPLEAPPEVAAALATPAATAPVVPVTDYNQPAPPVAKQPPAGYTGPWPSLYKDADGNPTNTYAPGVVGVDQGDPTTW